MATLDRTATELELAYIALNAANAAGDDDAAVAAFARIDAAKAAKAAAGRGGRKTTPCYWHGKREGACGGMFATDTGAKGHGGALITQPDGSRLYVACVPGRAAMTGARLAKVNYAKA